MSEVLEAPQVHALSINTPAASTLTGPATALLQEVADMIIDGPAMYQYGADELQSIKRKANALDAQRREITDPLDQAKKRVMDLYRGPLELLAQAESMLKRKMIGYTQQVERERQAEQARLEEIARKEREKIEAQARKAEEKGKTEKAETLRAEAQSIPVAVVLPSAAPKIAGQSIRKNYSANVRDFGALVCFIAGVEKLARPDLLGLALPNMPALNAQARSLKMAMQLPGVEAVEEQVLASRA